ncbi:MAG TPA: GDYXXLXY domain-containing protein [Verrucomicrobiae bacterium]|nr:GDYXXLXY domain-containing protein [Verrucomicrobiae bacterium]
MKLKLLVLVLALQSVWLLGTVVQQENILHAGTAVLLETQPVDPRDPLRGDYVSLNYKINNIPRDKFSPLLDHDLPAGTKVYAAIAPAGTNGFWEVTRADIKVFTPANNEVILRGKCQWGWQNSPGSVRVEYGIEHYFVAEGTGNPRGKLTVQVAVSGSGRGSIKEVFVNGQPYADAMKKLTP